MAIETIGVRVVVEGANKAVDDLNRVNKAASSLGGAAAATASPLGILGSALANVGQIAAGIISAHLFTNLVEGLKSVAYEALFGAGRVEELEVILELLGTRAGYSASQLYQWRDAMVDAGIRSDVATKSIAEFIRYQMDATKAVELAAVAQDAATFAAEDSTEALAGLMHGILTQRSIVLRTYGIIVDTNQAMEDYKDVIGAVGRELTASERVQAMMNAVLAQGVAISGAYEAAMGTWTKMWRTLTGRLIPEMIWQLGGPFQQVMGSAVFAIADFVKVLTAAVSEGGRLRPILDALVVVVNRLLAPVIALTRVVGDWLGTTAEGAKKVTKAMEEMAGKVTAVQAPNLAAAFESGATKIIDANRDLTKSITRMWDDHNRRLVQTTFDFNLGRLRDELDWQRRRERGLEEHNRKMADMYAELDELRTGKQRQEIKAQMQDEQKDYATQRSQFERLLAQAQSDEEKQRIQGWLDVLAIEHQGNQEALQEEVSAIDAEQAALEKRIALEEKAFKDRRALEAEDRRIRLAREDEDFARRTAREEEEARRRETLQREETTERIALIREQIAEENAAKLAAYQEQGAMLTQSVGEQKGILEELGKEQKSLIDEWKTTIEGWFETIKDVDWKGLAADVSSIAQSLGDIAGPAAIITGILTTGYIRGLITSFGGFNQVLKGTGDIVQGIFGLDIPRILTGTKTFVEGWMITFIGFFGGALQSVYNLLTGKSVRIVDDVVDELRRLSSESTRLGGEFIEGLILGINRWWQQLINRVRELAEAIIYEVKVRLLMGSPSKVFIGIGQEISRSLAEGIRSMGDLPALQMGQVTLGTLAAVPASTTTVSNSYNLNMTSMAPVSTVVSDFRLIKVIAGR